MKNIYLKSAVTLFAAQLLIGCGGDSSSGGGSDGDQGGSGPTLTKGYFLDSAIVGANYECSDGKRSVTITGGEFSCESAPVTFKVGDLTLGSISNFTTDTKVYLQDLLGLERSNYTDENLIGMARLIQALDDDGDISEEIVIPQDMAAQFVGASGNNWSALAAAAAVTLVSEADAVAHLQGQSGSGGNGGSGSNGYDGGDGSSSNADDGGSGATANGLVFNQDFLDNLETIHQRYNIYTCETVGLNYNGTDYDEVASYTRENPISVYGGIEISVSNGVITMATNSGFSQTFEVFRSYENYSVVKSKANIGGFVPPESDWSYWYKESTVIPFNNPNQSDFIENGFYHEGRCSATSFDTHIKSGNIIGSN